jgi:two-component system nitrogen regulation sensor histidine kinase NtrY
MPLRCDTRLVGQALVNIVKNAIEAIDARIAEGTSDAPGKVSVSVAQDDHYITVTVEDNGKGLPQQGRERLTEPYVTTRTKGTGLGLAIVRKIMEDHGGELALADREPNGARVTLVFVSDARVVQRPAPAITPAELSPATHGA